MLTVQVQTGLAAAVPPTLWARPPAAPPHGHLPPDVTMGCDVVWPLGGPERTTFTGEGTWLLEWIPWPTKLKVLRADDVTMRCDIVCAPLQQTQRKRRQRCAGSVEPAPALRRCCCQVEGHQAPGASCVPKSRPRPTAPVVVVPSVVWPLPLVALLAEEPPRLRPYSFWTGRGGGTGTNAPTDERTQTQTRHSERKH